MKLLTLIGVILIIATIIYVWYPRKEGFATTATPAPTKTTDGTIAAGAGTAATGGATTVDPTQSLPQPKDALALQESYKNFVELATAKDPSLTDLKPELARKMVLFRDDRDSVNGDIQILLSNPAQLGLTSQQVNDIRTMTEGFIEKLRAANLIGITQSSVSSKQQEIDYALKVASQIQPTTQAGMPGVISLAELKNLKVRIETETRRLQDLRSQAASVLSRIQHLVQLGADLGDMISRVERKVMKLEDVPITPEAADLFLRNLRSNTGPVPALVTATKATPSTLQMTTPASSFEMPVDKAAVEELMALSRNLKWSLEVRLEHDPTLAHKERIMSHLRAIMQHLTNMSISGASVTSDSYDRQLRDLKEVQRLLSLPATNTASKNPEFGTMSRLSSQSSRVSSAATSPDHLQLMSATGAASDSTATGTCENATFPFAGESNDYKIRPGFVMNDEQIARRPSAASYNGEGVGGPDYKERALNLCRQIKEGALGDVASFGCIANPDAVGPNYSWKGNFMMVCNRLGDSWGRKYPEQFGCPPYDPTAKFSSGV